MECQWWDHVWDQCIIRQWCNHAYDVNDSTMHMNGVPRMRSCIRRRTYLPNASTMHMPNALTLNNGTMRMRSMMQPYISLAYMARLGCDHALRPMNRESPRNAKHIFVLYREKLGLWVLLSLWRMSQYSIIFMPSAIISILMPVFWKL